MAFLLIHRLYRLRRDAIFFHAASIDIGGAGVMLIGPKGAGKSTTSLALAARGVPLLGDEIACWIPATGMLEPFLRPVGIKPGPGSMAVTAALQSAARHPVTEVLRIDVETFMPVTRGAAVPLKAVMFLDGFHSEPSLQRISPGREELALLQPVTSSLVNAPRGRRVLQLAHLVSTTAVFRLRLGQADDTAEFLTAHLGDYLA